MSSRIQLRVLVLLALTSPLAARQPAAAQVAIQVLADAVRINALTPNATLAFGTSSSTPCAASAAGWTIPAADFVPWFSQFTFREGSTAHAVTPDGRFVAGTTAYAPTIDFAGPIVWDRQTGQPRLLPHGPTGYGYIGAYGLSSDGSVVVGKDFDQAVIWVGTTPPIPIVPAASGVSYARGVSADGSRVVGVIYPPPHFYTARAFTWTAATGVVLLPSLSPDVPYDPALAISADGLTIAGYSGSPNTGVRLTRWRINPATGAVSILALAPAADFNIFYSSDPVAAISPDGRVIGGSAGGFNPVGDNAPPQPVVWSEASGLIALPAILAQSGVDVGALGTELLTVTSISADGRTVAGNGFGIYCEFSYSGYSPGWIVTLDCTSVSHCPADFNCSGGQPNVQDILAFLTAWFAADPRTNLDHSGVPPAVTDIFRFLTAWFAGC